jgi:hypothetical protein
MATNLLHTTSPRSDACVEVRFLFSTSVCCGLDRLTLFLPRLSLYPPPRLAAISLAASHLVYTRRNYRPLFPLVELARVPCCVLKLPSVVVHEVAFHFLGLIHWGRRSPLFLFSLHLSHIVPLLFLAASWPLPIHPPTHPYHNRNSWASGTPAFLSPSVPSLLYD